MDVHRIISDHKLNWEEYVAKAIKKSNGALYAFRMIKQFFNPAKIKILLLNAYYYSTLYYNFKIWLISFLQTGPKQQLLFASSNAICSSTFHLKTSKYKKN
jgi:uncharacterized membrane protein